MKKSELRNIIKESIEELRDLRSKEKPVEIFTLTNNETGETSTVDKNHKLFPWVLNQIKKGNAIKLNEVACGPINEGPFCCLIGGCCTMKEKVREKRGSWDIVWKACCAFPSIGRCCN